MLGGTRVTTSGGTTTGGGGAVAVSDGLIQQTVADTIGVPTRAVGYKAGTCVEAVADVLRPGWHEGWKTRLTRGRGPFTVCTDPSACQTGMSWQVGRATVASMLAYRHALCRHLSSHRCGRRKRLQHNSRHMQ